MPPPGEPLDGDPINVERSHRTKGLLRLTMACNERCPFCNVPVEDYPRPTPPPEQTQEELDAFVKSGARTLTISGGEPTLLRKRLLSVIRSARQRGIPFVELQTNAILIDQDYAAALAEAGLTSAFVSLLSHRAALHDELAGLAGAYPRCIRGIETLLDHGIRVTLNPVIARSTEHLVADFIDFVGEQLSGVREISMSAVQPQGRAGRGRAPADLLPDYAILAEQLPEARRRAAGYGLRLLNPYCGLPLCVGWATDQSHSVEAIEAASGGWRATPGIENTGDKIHGEPCQRCVLRTRCGGAWRDYWRIRGGSGIQAPAVSLQPWLEGADSLAEQQVIAAPGGPGPRHLEALRLATSPTVWLWTDRLTLPIAQRLRSAGCTDLALEIDPVGMAGAARRRIIKATGLQVAFKLSQEMAPIPPQHRLRIHLGLRPSRLLSVDDLLIFDALASRSGFETAQLLVGDDNPHHRRLDSIRTRCITRMSPARALYPAAGRPDTDPS